MIFPHSMQWQKKGLSKVRSSASLSKMEHGAFTQRVTDSIVRSGGIDNKAHCKSSLLLKYVSGDYKDPGTFATIKRRSATHGVRRITGYNHLHSSKRSSKVWARRSSPARARVVESRLDAIWPPHESSTRWHISVFLEDSIFRIDHFLGKEAIMNILYFRFANSFLSRSGTATTLRVFRYTLGEFRVGKRGAFYERGLLARCDPESSLRSCASCHGTTASRTLAQCTTEKAKVFQAYAAS